MRARYGHNVVRESISNGQFAQAAEQLTGGLRRRPEALAQRCLGMVGAMLENEPDREKIKSDLHRLICALEKAEK